MRVKEFTMPEAQIHSLNCFLDAVRKLLQQNIIYFTGHLSFLHQINLYIASCSALPFHHLNHAA